MHCRIKITAVPAGVSGDCWINSPIPCPTGMMTEKEKQKINRDSRLIFWRASEIPNAKAIKTSWRMTLRNIFMRIVTSLIKPNAMPSKMEWDPRETTRAMKRVAPW